MRKAAFLIMMTLVLIDASDKSENKLKIGIKKRVRHIIIINAKNYIIFYFRLKIVNRKVEKEICYMLITKGA